MFVLAFAGDIGNYYYGQGHPMKPHRIRMTHNLLLNYGLYRKMEIYVRFPSSLTNCASFTLFSVTHMFTCLFVCFFCFPVPEAAQSHSRGDDKVPQ